MAKNWPSIIDGLKDLIAQNGPIWPGSTKLAGFASSGPYSCAHCEYLVGGNRCRQEVMMADTEVDHDAKGLAIITDAAHQCCEFVEPESKLTQIEPQGNEHKLVALFMRHGDTAANREKLFRGPMNIPLDDKGKQQALDGRRFLAGYLQGSGKKIGNAYRSSKDRTRETADLVLGPGKTETVKNLDALNVGKFAGQPKTDANMKEILHYQKNPDQKIPGGERINDFRARTNPEIERIIADGEESANPPIAFVHSSTIHQVNHLIHGDHNINKVLPGGIVGVYKRPNGSLYVSTLLRESKSTQDQHMMS